MADNKVLNNVDNFKETEITEEVNQGAPEPKKPSKGKKVVKAIWTGLKWGAKQTLKIGLGVGAALFVVKKCSGPQYIEVSLTPEIDATEGVDFVQAPVEAEE